MQYQPGYQWERYNIQNSGEFYKSWLGCRETIMNSMVELHGDSLLFSFQLKDNNSPGLLYYWQIREAEFLCYCGIKNYYRNKTLHNRGRILGEIMV